MSIIVTCSCGKQFKARSEFVGRRATCRSCGAVLMIGPQPAPVPSPVHASGGTVDPPHAVDDSNQAQHAAGSHSETTSPPLPPWMNKTILVGGLVFLLMLIASVATAIVMLNSEDEDAHSSPKGTSQSEVASSLFDGVDQSGRHSALPPNPNKASWRSVLDRPLSYDLRPKVAYRQLCDVLEMWDSMPKDQFFRIIAKIGPGLYEAVMTNVDGKAVTGNLILKTRFTEFESIGRTRMTVTFEGTVPMSLDNGFTKDMSVFQEAISDRDGRLVPTKEAQELDGLAFWKSHAARRIVIAAMMLDGYEYSDGLTDKALSDYLGKTPEGYSFFSPRSIGREVQKLFEGGHTALSYSVQTGDANLSDAVRRVAP